MVSGGWLRNYKASQIEYIWWRGNAWRNSVSRREVSDTPGAIWNGYAAAEPELDVWQRECGIESGFRIRINVKGVGRIEYGLTYEWALSAREGIELDNALLEEGNVRLDPQMNAFRMNLAWYPLRWERSGKWTRVQLPKG